MKTSVRLQVAGLAVLAGGLFAWSGAEAKIIQPAAGGLPACQARLGDAEDAALACGTERDEAFALYALCVEDLEQCEAGGGGGGHPYDGTWTLNAVRIVPPGPACDNDESTTQTGFASVNKEGLLIVVAGDGNLGTMSTSGVLSFSSIPDEHDGGNSGCPNGGSGTGTCSTTSSCSGTFNGNDSSVWSFTLTR